ncbi:MAG: hypothetical protein M3T56_19590 [Chloroflexota bacterium]|nr:hypothetical protein [Chloroflexota bacterium]
MALASLATWHDHAREPDRAAEGTPTPDGFAVCRVAPSVAISAGGGGDLRQVARSPWRMTFDADPRPLELLSGVADVPGATSPSHRFGRRSQPYRVGLDVDTLEGPAAAYASEETTVRGRNDGRVMERKPP